MSFKSLEQRFNERVNVLYAGSTLKFKNGLPSTGRNDDPLIVRRPGNGYWTSAESRATPISSAIQDTKRMTLFLSSARGVKFLAKQQLLQTGNTFAMTRIINPAFVVANATPFLHVKRNLRPVNLLRGPTDTSYQSIKKFGKLQQETFNTLKTKPVPNYVKEWVNIRSSSTASTSQNQNVTTQRRSLLSRITSSITSTVRQLVKDKINQVVSPITSTISSVVGGTNGYVNGKPEVERPEAAGGNSIVDITYNINTNWQRGTYNRDYNLISGDQITHLKYFNGGRLKSSKVGQSNGDINYAPAKAIISDPLNLARKNKGTSTNIYSDLQTETSVKDEKIEDIIMVSFKMGRDEPVQFRAFIKDIQQSVQSTPREYQYIGRTEKFISYGTVQRKVTFKLDVIAFSQNELPIVWKRINYLTGLLFPYGINRGILQPNIIYLTIGKLYTAQPGYVTSINTRFNETAESWDIDPSRQVPIAATTDIDFTIIEKRTALATSPFYAINEQPI